MFDSIQYFFEVGGWAMYGIVLCSITALAIFLERLWTLRQSRVMPREFCFDIEVLLKKGEIEAALTLCQRNRSPLAKIFCLGLSQVRAGLSAVKEMLTEESERQAYALERGVGVLNMIVTLAPLLGFLGTVLGMVELFSSIAAEGEVRNVGVIAGGVYKALYTTVAGLTVAIPATLFHKYCLASVDQRILEIDEVSLKVLSLLSNSRPMTKS